MVQYIIVIAFFIIAISLMLAALHFSQYKKRPSGCCGGIHCGPDRDKVSSCYHEKLDFVDNYKPSSRS